MRNKRLLYFKLSRKGRNCKKEVNNLKTKKPFSYSFRTEQSYSSVFGVNASPEAVLSHFDEMFNKPLGDTDLNADLIVNHPPLDSFNFAAATPTSLAHTISKMKNSMPGIYMIPMVVYKGMDDAALSNFFVKYSMK